MTLQRAECGGRRQSRVPPYQSLIVLSAAFLVLSAFLVTIGLLQVLTPRAVDHVSAENHPIKRSPAASSATIGSAPLSVAVLPDAQPPGMVTAVGRPTPKPSWWWAMTALNTVDGDPGGILRFDNKTGEVTVCDVEADDGHLVRGKVTLQGKEVQAQDGKKLAIKVAGKNKCYVKTIENYDPQKDYKFHVCLAASDESPDGYCNTSGNTDPWPQPDREEYYCNDLDVQEHLDCTGGELAKCNNIPGEAKNYCEYGTLCTDPVLRKKEPRCKLGPADWDNPIPPPAGRIPSLNETPDLALPNGPAAGYDDPRMAVPMRKILTWLTWATLGACVAGYMLIGAKMAISHKRGEVHAHGAELGWVLIATVIAATGLAIYFVGLVVIPI